MIIVPDFFFFLIFFHTGWATGKIKTKVGGNVQSN